MGQICDRSLQEQTSKTNSTQNNSAIHLCSDWGVAGPCAIHSDRAVPGNKAFVQR
jgi:hypothetical protein